MISEELFRKELHDRRALEAKRIAEMTVPDSSIVTTYRADWYETPDGSKRQLYCACDVANMCLYHWYYEIKGGNPPKEENYDGEVENAGVARAAGSDHRGGSRGKGGRRSEPGVHGDRPGAGVRPAQGHPRKSRG